MDTEAILRWLERLPGWAWALPVLLLIAVGLRAGIGLSRWVLARRPGRSRRLGRSGMARALALLHDAGYDVLGTEVVEQGTVEVDGREQAFSVRVDAIVERKGRTWVAEVKSGEVSSSIGDRGTRRQLLEYAHVFQAEGVLLVDARRGRIHGVRFPPPR